MRRFGLALVLVLTGCYAWPSRPVSDIGTPGPTIRVLTNGGMRAAVLEGAAAVGDSVIGRLSRVDTLHVGGWATLQAGSGERTAIPVAAITRLQIRELDQRRTFAPLAVLGGVALLVGAIAAMLPPTVGYP